jgi:hypothetical protein
LLRLIREFVFPKSAPGCQWLAQYDMASTLESNRQGAIRLDNAVYTKVLVEEGLDATPKARNQLKERVKKARKLFQICRGFDRGLFGLLPFMKYRKTSFTI